MVYLYLTSEQDQAKQWQMQLFLLALVVMLISLVIASPYLISLVTGITSRVSRRAPLIIGTKYVQAHCRKSARAVSGVVLALFSGVFFLTTVSDLSVLDQILNHNSSYQDSTVVLYGSENKAATNKIVQVLKEKPYVEQADMISTYAQEYAFVSCQQAKAYLTSGCSQGFKATQLMPNHDAEKGEFTAASPQELKKALATQFDADLLHEEPTIFVKLKNPASLDVLRSDLVPLRSKYDPTVDFGMLIDGNYWHSDDSFATYYFMSYLVYGGMFMTLTVAVISLLISTYSSILERRRALHSLRLAGMRVKEITNMMLLEALVPLIIITAVSLGTGYGSAWLLMNMASRTLHAHFSPYLLVMVVSALALCAAAIWALTPTMKRITSPQNNWSE